MPLRSFSIHFSSNTFSTLSPKKYVSKWLDYCVSEVLMQP